MAKDTEIRLRVTTEFKKKVQELAKKENRTLSNYILNVLEKEIEQKNKGH